MEQKPKRTRNDRRDRNLQYPQDSVEKTAEEMATWLRCKRRHQRRKK